MLKSVRKYIRVTDDFDYTTKGRGRGAWPDSCWVKKWEEQKGRMNLRPQWQPLSLSTCNILWQATVCVLVCLCVCLP